MVGLPNIYKKVLPQHIQDNRYLLKFLTGISIAIVEATLLCPIERVKVHFMTYNSGSGERYVEFFRGIKGNLFNELFRGYTPLIIR